MFSAYKTSGGYDAGKYVDTYDKFFSNYGSSFSLSTGIFTAPRAGVYEFFAAMYQQWGDSSKNNDINVMKNDEEALIFSSWYDSSSYRNHDTVSFSWIMSLQQGDTIGLKVKDGYFKCTGDAGCIFNGKFIRKL